MEWQFNGVSGVYNVFLIVAGGLTGLEYFAYIHVCGFGFWVMYCCMIMKSERLNYYDFAFVLKSSVA